MRRIGLAVILVVSLLAPLAVEAQQPTKTPRIAIVFANAREASVTGPTPKASYAKIFLDAMRVLGWVDGQNITIERRSVEGHPERLAGLAEQLARRPVDLIVVVSTKSPIIAVKQAIGSIPLVWLSADPSWLVRVGLAESMARPGGTVTGLTLVAGPEIEAKLLQLLKEAIPRAARVAYLTDDLKSEFDGLPILPLIEAAARDLSITILPIEVAAPEQLDRAFVTSREKRVDAVFMGPNWFFLSQLPQIVKLAAREQLPTIYLDRQFVERGGLMSYGADWADLFRRAPIYVDKILKGARPGDLPIEQPTKFELVINMKTATALGLTIPQTLLLRADQIIE
jgi:putative ABC transport system substrate-binding protein